MGWLVGWARSRHSRSTFVTDGLIDAQTCARHRSPKKCRPRPSDTVLVGLRCHRHDNNQFGGPSTTFRKVDFFGRRRPSCGVRAHEGSEATSQKMCARCGISSQRGQRPRVCKKLHSNLTLGDSALTIRGSSDGPPRATAPTSARHVARARDAHRSSRDLDGRRARRPRRPRRRIDDAGRRAARRPPRNCSAESVRVTTHMPGAHDFFKDEWLQTIALTTMVRESPQNHVRRRDNE